MLKQKVALGIPNELRRFARQFTVRNSYAGNLIDNRDLHSIKSSMLKVGAARGLNS
jgi:hypothetical protein